MGDRLGIPRVVDFCPCVRPQCIYLAVRLIYICFFCAGVYFSCRKFAVTHNASGERVHNLKTRKRPTGGDESTGWTSVCPVFQPRSMFFDVNLWSRARILANGNYC